VGEMVENLQKTGRFQDLGHESLLNKRREGNSRRWGRGGGTDDQKKKRPGGKGSVLLTGVRGGAIA